MPDCASGGVRLVAGVTGENTAPVPADQSQLSRSLVTLLGGDAVVEQIPGQPAELKIRTAEALKPVSGSLVPQFSAVLLNATVATMPEFAMADDDGSARRITAASAALAAFKPADEIEGMIAAQAVALHSTGMECLRRSMIPEQPPEAALKLRKDGANLMRSMTDMLDALDRKRGKGPQVVRVERVVVHEGGQAVVGNVQAGG